MQSMRRVCVCVCAVDSLRRKVLTPQFIVVAAALRLSTAVTPVAEVALVVQPLAQQPGLQMHQHDTAG